MSDNIYSLHHFFFPFKWDVLPDKFKKTAKKEDFPFDNRTSLDKFEGHLVKDSKWARSFFKIDANEDYNEFTYFYSFVRKTLYDVIEYNDGIRKSKHEVLRYYEYKINQGQINQYIIEYLQKEGTISTLYLKVSGISLHVFDTGIAILSFSLINNYPGQETPNKILLINEFGRRIYPQFLGKDGLLTTQKIFLAKSIKLKIGNSVEFKETFENYKGLSDISVHKTFYLPKFIAGLFNEENFVFHIESDFVTSKVLLSRVVDDRLFFLCWYGNNVLSKSLSTFEKNDADWWYAFISGDKVPKSIANAELQKRHINEHTYARWLEYGTLYGMSRDSFVCISSDINYMNENDLPRIDVHMNSIYYQLVILCLAQKASILKFSAEIANLSDSAFEKEYGDILVSSVKSIYSNYIEFVNKIYFKEVSSQIQAIEIYTQLQGIMSVNNDVERLNTQIATLFNYLNFQKDERQNLEAHKLTWFATLFLPASFIASLFGIGFITEKTVFSGTADPKIWIAWSIIIGLGGGMSWIIFRFRNKF